MESHSGISTVGTLSGWSEIDAGISTQSSFTGPHFVVLAGYDGENIYVNDPLWREPRRMEGFRKVWSYRKFNAAWGSNYIDRQRDYSGIVCDLTLPTANWDPQTEEQEPIYQLDPAMSRRIKAWTSYHDIPEPEITGPAVENAYIEAMGAWRERTAEHEVGETDTLGLLALRYYDNPLKYPTITLFNGLTATDTIHDEDMLTILEPLERLVEIPDEEWPIGGSTPHQDRIRLLNELKIEADRVPRLDYERR